MRRTTLTGLLALILCSPLAYGQHGADPCAASPITLCLNGNRFKVEVDWMTEAGHPGTVQDFDGSGSGRVIPVSDDWTGFWFFDPDNLEVAVHVFDDCAGGGKFWVFAAGLTDVETTLTVTDTESGQVSIYSSPDGTPFQPITDTNAFATCPGGQQKSAASKSIQTPQSAAENTTEAAGDCMESAGTSCLHDGRFEVSVETGDSTSPVQKLSGGTAGFPFINPTFFDLFVTINDGSSANGRYWVTYSMFDPLDFVLTVVDHETGETRIYTHTVSDPIYVQDRQAFSGDDALTIDGTLSGSWLGTERSGEGFIFDVAVVGGIPTLVLFYFTYENNNSGRQAWLVGSAPIIGNKASVPVIIADGAQFGPAMDPDSVNRMDWGNVKVSFNGCNNALVESDSPFFPAVRYELVRLTPAPTGVEGVCQSAVSVPVDTTIDGGYSGSWYQVARDGEGFIFNVAVIDGVNTLVVFYFTYENNTSGRQAWLVGSAPIIGNSADVPMVITDGTEFGAAFNPDKVVRTPWGNIKVTWSDCDLANIEVTSELFGDISFDINRLTPPTIGATGNCGGGE